MQSLDFASLLLGGLVAVLSGLTLWVLKNVFRRKSKIFWDSNLLEETHRLDSGNTLHVASMNLVVKSDDLAKKVICHLSKDNSNNSKTFHKITVLPQAPANTINDNIVFDTLKPGQYKVTVIYTERGLPFRSIEDITCENMPCHKVSFTSSPFRFDWFEKILIYWDRISIIMLTTAVAIWVAKS